MDASEIKPTDAFLRLKVNDLKEICLAGGLARSGRKADLQQRILTAAKHAGRVQQALERLLPNSMPFAHAAPPTPHHHGGASGSAIGRPLMPTGAVGGVGTGELRCPCGSHGRCNPQDPSARLVRCVVCSSYLQRYSTPASRTCRSVSLSSASVTYGSRAWECRHQCNVLPRL